MTRIASFALVCLSLVLPQLAGLAAAPPGSEGPVLVLHAPWADGTGIVRAAGGRPIGPADGPLATLASAPDPDAFRERLRAAGAWSVLDARAIAAFCDTSPHGRARRLTSPPAPDPQP
jgi:hypothetical protein